MTRIAIGILAALVAFITSATIATADDGVIIDVTGTGDKTEAVINFRDRGRKHLLLAWAPLKKV